MDPDDDIDRPTTRRRRDSETGFDDMPSSSSSSSSRNRPSERRYKPVAYDDRYRPDAVDRPPRPTSSASSSRRPSSSSSSVSKPEMYRRPKTGGIPVNKQTDPTVNRGRNFYDDPDDDDDDANDSKISTSSLPRPAFLTGIRSVPVSTNRVSFAPAAATRIIDSLDAERPLDTETAKSDLTAATATAESVARQLDDLLQLRRKSTPVQPDSTIAIERRNRLKQRMHKGFGYALQNFLMNIRIHADNIGQFQERMKSISNSQSTPAVIMDFIRQIHRDVPDVLASIELLISADVMLLMADRFRPVAIDVIDDGPALLPIDSKSDGTANTAAGWIPSVLPVAVVDPFRFFKRLAEELCKSMYNWSISDTYSDEPWNLDGLRSLIDQAITDTVDEFTPLPLPKSIDTVTAAIDRSAAAHDEQVRGQAQLVHLMQHRSPWIAAARKVIGLQTAKQNADIDMDRRILELRSKRRDAVDAVEQARSAVLIDNMRRYVVDAVVRKSTSNNNDEFGKSADRMATATADLVDAVKQLSVRSRNPTSSSGPSLYPTPTGLPNPLPAPSISGIPTSYRPVNADSNRIPVNADSNRMPVNADSNRMPVNTSVDDTKTAYDTRPAASTGTGIDFGRPSTVADSEPDRRDSRQAPPQPPLIADDVSNNGNNGSSRHRHSDRHAERHSDRHDRPASSSSSAAASSSSSDNRRPPTKRQTTSITTALARDYIKSLSREHPPPAASGGRS